MTHYRLQFVSWQRGTSSGGESPEEFVEGVVIALGVAVMLPRAGAFRMNPFRLLDSVPFGVDRPTSVRPGNQLGVPLSLYPWHQVTNHRCKIYIQPGKFSSPCNQARVVSHYLAGRLRQV